MPMVIMSTAIIRAGSQEAADTMTIIQGTAKRMKHADTA